MSNVLTTPPPTRSASPQQHAGIDVRQTLLRQRDRLARRVQQRVRLSRRYARVRLAIVLLGVVLAFAAFQGAGTAAGWGVVLLFLGAFVVAARRHERVETSLARHRLWRGIKDRHLARLELDWTRLPEPPAAPAPADHPFAADLDVLGSRSLHHLLDTSGSRGGSLRLRDWLLEPSPDLGSVVARQRLVRELVPLGLFRDRLALLSLEVSAGPAERWDDRPLLQWLGRGEEFGALRPWLVGLSLFAVANVLLVVGHAGGLLPAVWPFTLVAYFAVYFTRYRAFQHLFSEASDLEDRLARFTPALLQIEQFRFPAASALAETCIPVQQASRRPSRQLRRVRRIAAAASLTRNELAWVILNVLMPWELLITYLLHRTTRDLRDQLPAWLDTLYQVEALSSLAAHAEAHPDRAFPDLMPDAEAARPALAAEALGHPLLPDAQKVRNDVSIERMGEILLITGSNMSGKSTFLRTVGVNLCLAYAGAPADAARLRAPCFRLFTCMNVSDSVHDGLSFFYAEVRRLRALLDATRLDAAPPVLYLIDEIFRGTNNRERLAGSRAYVRALAGGRSTGLISTHDLELAQLEEELPQVHNHHFRESIKGGEMTFDYTLRHGASPTTNALQIMRLAGLPVPENGVTR